MDHAALNPIPVPSNREAFERFRQELVVAGYSKQTIKTYLFLVGDFLKYNLLLKFLKVLKFVAKLDYEIQAKTNSILKTKYLLYLQ